MRISDWSSDVCSSDLTTLARGWGPRMLGDTAPVDAQTLFQTRSTGKAMTAAALAILVDQGKIGWDDPVIDHMPRSEEYKSELKSLMRSSYDAFCLKKKKKT